MRYLLPEGWPRPSGYSNGIIADGVQVHVAGMIGWNEKGELADTFEGQVEQSLRNTLAVLAEGDAGPEHIVRMTWYVTDLDAYRSKLKEVGAAWRSVIGRHFPAMAVVGVSDLVERDALVEIESIAVLD